SFLFAKTNSNEAVENQRAEARPLGGRVSPYWMLSLTRKFYVARSGFPQREYLITLLPYRKDK
ncbi:MAG TPA: hypothetical protein VJK01_00675, partial [Candidatus Paceibacterota bacterium]